MSYILDALRKSEKERRRGEVPHVLSQQDAPYPARKPRSLRPYFFLAVLAVNAAVLLWVFKPWPQKAPPPPALSGPAPTLPQVEAEKTAPKTAEKPSKKTEATRKDSPTVPAAKSRSSDPEGEKGKPPQALSAKRQVNPAAQPGPASAGPLQQIEPVQKDAGESKAAPEIPPPMPHRLYSLAELPPGLKQQLPALSLSLTVHSDDRASRLATINGQTVREGQTLPGGVKVEEILQDSAVLTFQGYRFGLHMR